jgi:Uncharacterized protein conserved in bacteria (DUF2188)
MPDISVIPHGDRWSVVEQGAESATKEFPTREAAEMAARQMADGGAVETLEEDPTGLRSAADDDSASPASTGALKVPSSDSPSSSRPRQAIL